MNNHLQKRQNVIKGIFITVVIILVSRLFYIQIINEEREFSSEVTIKQVAARGAIYDRNGKLMVSIQASYDLTVIPNEVIEFDTLRLCELTDLSIEDFRIKLKKAKDYSKYKKSIISEQLPNKSAAQIREELNSFKGFDTKLNIGRNYNVDVAGHIIGFLGKENEDMEGKSGIELSYEEKLKGKAGTKVMLVDVLNIPRESVDNGDRDIVAIHGKNIFITLDIDLQEYAEKLMQNKIGAIVAIEPSSGEILTLVSSPTYSPKDLIGRERSKNYTLLCNDTINKPLFNRALNGIYPPASPLKIVNGLIALQEGSLNKNSHIACNSGFLYGNNKILKCHKHPNLVNLKSAIYTSCNTYFCNLWESFFDKYNSVYKGYDVWKEHVESFGFGNYLNNDFKSGQKGYIPESSHLDKKFPFKWQSSTILSMSIGQGELNCTPIQMANLSAIIANRGFYYIPHIIKGIENDTIPSRFSEKQHTSIDPQHFETIIDGMAQVLSDIDGTAFGHGVKGLSICGKTGTAQNNHGEDHSIFIAFAPKEKPKIAIAVYIETAGWGSEWAAPIATLIIEKYLNNTISRPILEEKMINGNLINKE